MTLPCTTPKILSFITLRAERFGGLLFNPYLGEEAQLDPVETLIASLMNGSHSLSEIRDEAARRFAMAAGQARDRVDGVLKKLTGLYAVVVHDAEPVTRPIAPECPVFDPDGPQLSAPKDVVWDLTYACNLRCRHCLTDSGERRTGELDTGQAKLLIDRLAEAKVLRLALSGGEPFLRQDLVTLLAHLATKKMRVEILSNGVAIPLSVLEALRGLPIFQVQISLDGIGEEHDALRGRVGAFRDACEALVRLKAEGVATSVSTTVTRANVGSLDRIIDLAVSLGTCGYKAIPLLPAGRGRRHAKELILSKEQQLGMCITIQRRARELQGTLKIAVETAFLSLLGEARRQGCGGPMGCSAGHDTLHVGADGTLHPCPFLLDFPLGHVLQQPLSVVWAQAPVLRTLRNIDKADVGEPCSSCDYAPIACRGGCRAAAYFEHGDLRAPDPNCFRDQAAAWRGEKSPMMTG